MLLRKLAAIAAAAAAVGLAGVAAAEARSIYDGEWLVEVTGTTEACMGTARYTLNISNGVISYSGADASVSGRVSAKGAVTVRVSTGGQNAVGTGRLSRSYGSGRFAGRAYQGVCAGSWHGQRVS